MASKCSTSTKEEWQNENVYRFYRSQQGLQKDPFPLPRIDAFIDKAAGCQRFSLLDYFSGYHQIWLKKEDEEKTSFTKPFGTYRYTRMSEFLKNASATFTRMTTNVVSPQL
jgi:hypothetical protein